MNIACYIRNSHVYDQVRNALARVGYLSAQFDAETSLLRTLKRKTFDFIIIDLSSVESEDSIFSWLSLRSGDPTPTLALSSASGGDIVARALDSGADDFLQRPFEPVELVARINAVMRRCVPKNNRSVIEYAGFVLQRDTEKFSYQGIAISLTPREFTMAWLFFSSPGVYISRETLGSVIWSTDSEIAGRTIEQHVYKLRKKLQVDNRNIVVIRTAYSRGYRLDAVGIEDASLDSMPPSNEA